jgi:hypothetical protein
MENEKGVVLINSIQGTLSNGSSVGCYKAHVYYSDRTECERRIRLEAVYV